MLRFFFGLGDYEEGSGQPYYLARNKEIAKLKSSMTRRKATLEEATLAARYCHAHAIPIKYVTDLFKHLSAAKVEKREATRPQLSMDVDEAIAYEHALADGASANWVAVLSRSQGDYRKGVLEEWRRARQPSQQAG